MLKPVRLIASLFVGLAMIIAAIAIADSSSAAPAAPRTTTTAHHATAASHTVAAASKPKHPPCGRKHYPKCPPKKHTGVGKHKCRRGGHETVTVKNYPPHTKVVVHLAGHHYYKLIRSTHTGKGGDAKITFQIPKHLKPGKYTVYVKTGNTTHAYHITVTK